jgi:hypothetical protein
VIARHGKVFLKRVAYEETSKCRTYKTSFNDDTRINAEIERTWRAHLEEEYDGDYRGAAVGDFLATLVDKFEFRDADVETGLCLWYDSFTNGTTKKRVVCKSDQAFSSLRIKDKGSYRSRPVTLADLHLAVSVPKGSKTWKDTTCDSDFMLDSMDEIGQAIRDSFEEKRGLTRNERGKYPDRVYLIMDNAGHGTKDAIAPYSRYLKRKASCHFFLKGLWRSTNSHLSLRATFLFNSSTLKSSGRSLALLKQISLTLERGTASNRR